MHTRLSSRFRFHPFILLLLAAVLLPLAAAAEQPYVILVSIDGFRFDYTDRYKPKNIMAVRDSGAAAESMIPSFPTITFPNHISIITGMYPAHHGIVGNHFFDPVKNAEYDYHRDATDGSWYMHGTPLWVLAEQQHTIAACMFWPTSDAEIQGVRPTYWIKYDGSITDEHRVKQVIDWLKLPAEKRPHFITLYFSDVDSAGHKYGPGAMETAEAVGLVDRMIGKLREDLAKLNLPVNLILVSDHGMQDTADGAVNLEREVDSSQVRVVLNGPVAFFYPKDGAAAEKTFERLRKDKHLDLYARDETPAAWHFRGNRRIGDFMALVKGRAVFTMSALNAQGGPYQPPRGEHGYDPRVYKSMHAIFYAVGPNVKPAAKIPSFENVNVYPFIAKILGLKTPDDLDGSFSVLAPVYVPN